MNENIDLNNRFNNLDRRVSNSGKRVEFNDDYISSSNRFDDETPKMAKLIMKLSGGTIKNEEQANYIILGFLISIIIISLFIVFGGNSKQPRSGTVPLGEIVPH